MDYQYTLLKMVAHLLDGTWTVSEFRDNYYDFYLEEVPDEAISEFDADFFGLIQEKLDWTDENPDPESRKYGWMDEAEFVKWVREHYDDYINKSDAVEVRSPKTFAPFISDALHRRLRPNHD